MKQIKDYDGYWINEKGDVFSFWNKVWMKGASGCKQEINYTLPPTRRTTHCPSGQRYWTISLKRNDGQWKRQLVHRLVLRAYVGDCPAGMVACHGCKGRNDNSLSNLGYDTHKNNMKRDRVRDGTLCAGDKSPTAKLKHKDVVAILKMRGSGCSQEEIGKAFGVSRSNISAIFCGRSWQHP